MWEETLLYEKIDDRPVIREGHKFSCAYYNTKDLMLSKNYKHIQDCGLSEVVHKKNRAKNKQSVEVGQMRKHFNILKEEAAKRYAMLVKAQNMAAKKKIATATKKKNSDAKIAAAKIAAAKNAATNNAAILKKYCPS